MQHSGGSDSDSVGPVAGGTPATGRQPKTDRGGNFLTLNPDIWNRLWEIDTQNRMNLVIAYLVLLAGTGRNHRRTKWSARACEQHTGMGKPRAQTAIRELINGGLIQHTEKSTKLFPEYLLTATPREIDAIFLPVPLITALGDEASMLRRVRETGDPVALRMLVDLYGQTQVDATYGMPISLISKMPKNPYPSRRTFTRGVHGIWAMPIGFELMVLPEFARHYTPQAQTDNEVIAAFAASFHRLESIGALRFEPWVFDSGRTDAEPLFPMQIEHFDGGRDADEDVGALTMLIDNAVSALTGDGESLRQRHKPDVLLPLTLHQSAPSVRGVLRMRIEADTPGRRKSYFLRKTQIETFTQSYAQLILDSQNGDHSRPMATSPAKQAR